MEVTHVDARPDLDGPITASCINHIFARPPDNIHTGRMAREDEFKSACGSIPYPDRAVF